MGGGRGWAGIWDGHGREGGQLYGVVVERDSLEN
jgi:hypothetical protein